MNSMLSLHSQQVRHDLAMINFNAPTWVPPRTASETGSDCIGESAHTGQKVLDVVIIGGGQSGIATAFGLLREQISNILIVDENPEGLEGPWLTYARMITLRTPKHLTGPDLGIPSLTFRAWWEAQFGPEGWESLDKIPRQDWMRYLMWLRAVLRLPVLNETRVERIVPHPDQGVHRLVVSGATTRGGGRDTILARKVVLATGIQGGGEWHVPAFIRDALPPDRYAHTADHIDYSRFSGKTIGILGGGASAFDNANHALGAGVREAHVFMRREKMQRINPIRHMEAAGFLRHFADLDDAEKYRGMTHFLAHSQPPTNDTFNRARSWPGFHLHLGAPWRKVEADGDAVRVITPKAEHRFDFIVVSTGLVTDLTRRPELSAVADDIALWSDRYKPPKGEECRVLDNHPYLAPDFSFTARADETGKAAARLHGLFLFNYGALASMGLSAASLSGMKHSLPRLISGISRQLFIDDRSRLLETYYDYDEVEFLGDPGDSPGDSTPTSSIHGQERWPR